MNITTACLAKLSKVLVISAITIACLPPAAAAQGPRALEGSWDVTVTLRNCQTGDAIRSFPRVITFGRGGTLAEAAAAGTEMVPSNRTAGQGEWSHLGSGEYTYSLKFLRLNSVGGPDGFIEETRVLQLVDGGGGFSADGVAVITFANGNQSPQLCATEEATRLY